ncbi:MAG TPA: hypothetical protein VFT20_16895, partial [Candidatus Limnocylindrales bacterium]|nr:hypothetical protein [Candidatus Limnocylindrales bacterium]
SAMAASSSVDSPVPWSSQSTEDLLHRALSAGAPWEAAATLEGTIGGSKGTVKGTIAARGDDLSLALVRTFGGESTRVRQVVVGGRSYVKYRDQAWQLVPQDETHPRPASLRSALMTVGCSSPQPGTLAMTGDDAVTVAEALGMVDPGTTGVDAEATITLRQDGNPDRLRLAFDSAIGRWDVAYAFETSATVDPIAPPAGAVAVWQQSLFLLLYPLDWEVQAIGQAPEIYDIFSSADGVATVWCEPTRMSPTEWTADGVRAYSEEWGAKPTEWWSVTYGANTWNVSDWAEATVAGDTGTSLVAATVHGGFGCDVTVFVVSSGDRERLLGAFGHMLASFTFLTGA